MCSAFWVSLRPKQWVKNFFVFVPLIFAREFTDPTAVKLTIYAFGIFALAASGIYLLNDVLDRRSDAAHPVKKHRPVAAGTLPVRVAIIAGFALVGTTALLAFWLNTLLGEIIVGYAILQLAYSLMLKHIVFIDLAAIASGFVLRVYAGAAAIDVPVSAWLLAITFLLALLLAAGKRLRELQSSQTPEKLARKVLSNYSIDRLENVVKILTIAIFASYLFYAWQTNLYLLLTAPIVAYGLLRYAALLHSKSAAECPTEMLLNDKRLLATAGFWGIAILVILSFA